MTGREVSPRRMEPYQRGGRRGEYDCQEDPGPDPGNLERREDQTEHAHREQGRSHRRFERLEHPDRGDLVRFRHRLVGGEWMLALESHGVRPRCQPEDPGDSRLRAQSPFDGDVRTNEQDQPARQESQGAPPPRPVDPGHSEHRQQQQGQHDGSRQEHPFRSRQVSQRPNPIASGSQKNRPSLRNRTRPQRPNVHQRRNVLSLRILTTT